MKLTKGNMFDAEGIKLVTTNSIRRKDGALVMGRGAALEACKRYPGIDKSFGDLVSIRGQYYGILLPWHLIPNLPCGAFQVKHHWKSEAQLPLIAYSTELLRNCAKQYDGEIFHLNFPGIGNGKLAREEVLPIIERLPDNVVVWEL